MMDEPLTTKQKIAELHKELDDMTPAENLAVAQEIIVELGRISSGHRADNARLRTALESIREQTKCKSVEGVVGAGEAAGCWFADYGRHAPDCQGEISEEAAEALKGRDAQQSEA